MSNREEQRIANLIKKNAAKANAPKPERRRQYDDTLRPAEEPEESAERTEMFKEMKRREF